MVHAYHETTIAVPAHTVWRLLADIESWPRWLRVPYASESVTISSAARVGVGTEFVLKGRLRSRLFARVTEWLENGHLAFEIYRSEYVSDRLFFARARISIELELVDENHTRVKAIHQLEGRGAWGRLYASTVMRPLLSSNVQRIVDSLAAASPRIG